MGGERPDEPGNGIFGQLRSTVLLRTRLARCTSGPCLSQYLLNETLAAVHAEQFQPPSPGE
ncbi:hypothetical protein D0Y50_15625 [Salinimonas sediminis]|uniref:Uncharacterized protein n=1 Tax=Salinimonas sediminis TaxID=2303538 RepID=A0A346NQ57_9ALTE|nr:hypothetical protein D0Y50_15625 [Salinimonas sediminis]